MRLPRSWDDDSLLQDAPFPSMFLIRNAVEQSNRRPLRSSASKIDWVKLVYDDLPPHMQSKLEAAADVWLEFAFASVSKESTTEPLEVPAGHPGLRIFIEFYWYLYTDKLYEGRSFLFRERSKRGFEYMLAPSLRGRSQGMPPDGSTFGISLSASPSRKRGHPSRMQPVQTDDPYDAEISQVEDDDRGDVTIPHDILQPPIASGPLVAMDAQVVIAGRAKRLATNTTLSGAIETTSLRKRKASKERPSSSSSLSSPSDGDPPALLSSGPTARHVESVAIPDDDDNAYSSPLTELPSEPEPEPIPRIDLNPAAVAIRQQPRRIASRPDLLAYRMERENKYGGKRTHVSDDSLSDNGPPRPQMAYRGRRKRASALSRTDRRTEAVPHGCQETVPPQAAKRGPRKKKDAVLPAVDPDLAVNAAPLLDSASVPQMADRGPGKKKEDIVPVTAPPPVGPAQNKRSLPSQTPPGPANSAAPTLRRSVRTNTQVPSAPVPSSVTPSVSSAPIAPTKKAKKAPVTRRSGQRSLLTKKARLKEPAGVETMERPQKRRRGNKDALNVAGNLAQVMASTVRAGDSDAQRRKSARLLSRDEDAAPATDQISTSTTVDSSSVRQEAVISEASVGADRPATRLSSDPVDPPVRTRTRGAQKRARDAQETTGASQPGSNLGAPARRVVRPLPSRKTPAPKPEPSGQTEVLRIRLPPPRPQYVNSEAAIAQVIQDAAAEAAMVNAVNMERPNATASSDWDGENEAYEGPPNSDSSDDERTAVTKAPRPRGQSMTVGIPSRRSAPPLATNVPAGMSQSTRPRPLLKDVGIHPPIWAESRQEVCESFNWFRSYQGGVYFLKDMVKGYLLSAFSADHDIFEHDGRLIVSHGGGKAEGVHMEDGQFKTHEADDQLAGDKSVRALLNTYRLRRATVLLIDDKYSLFPYDLAAEGYSYVVLGFYHIAHAWAERQPATNSRGYVVRYKFAFQWCQQQGTPWWIKDKTTAPTYYVPMFPIGTDGHRSGTPSQSSDQDDGQQQCQRCGTSSSTVYQSGWMCLKPSCAMFWKTVRGVYPPSNLQYADSFLRLLSCKHPKMEDLRPPPPLTDKDALAGNTTTRVSCKGWHCSQCGRLSCRYKWEHWECRNCGNTYAVSGRLRGPKEFWRQVPESFDTHWISKDSGILMPQTNIYHTETRHISQWYRFILPNNHGSIYLIRSSILSNTSPDEIFRGYQEDASSGRLSFRRWPLRAHKCRGTLLTNYFSQNSGEPYQYVGGTANTVPWGEAPRPVVDALHFIKTRMQAALGMSSGFNEVLSAAYMEKQSMAFHSDSERGLGPVVASLSLGSAAIMHFRPVLQRKGPKAANALSLYLRHGDVVVMEGADVQNCYEHTVVPRNFRIAATARSIGPDNRG